ncbi:hypothetical protein RFI_01681, partial [Reticulomyxa filosa]
KKETKNVKYDLNFLIERKVSLLNLFDLIGQTKKYVLFYFIVFLSSYKILLKSILNNYRLNINNVIILLKDEKFMTLMKILSYLTMSKAFKEMKILYKYSNYITEEYI